MNSVSEFLLGANRLLVQGAKRLGANRLGGNTTRYPFIDSSSCTDRIISEILDHFFLVSVNEQKVVLILTFRGDLYLKAFPQNHNHFVAGEERALFTFV